MRPKTRLRRMATEQTLRPPGLHRRFLPRVEPSVGDPGEPKHRDERRVRLNPFLHDPALFHARMDHRSLAAPGGQDAAMTGVAALVEHGDVAVFLILGVHAHAAARDEVRQERRRVRLAAVGGDVVVRQPERLAHHHRQADAVDAFARAPLVPPARVEPPAGCADDHLARDLWWCSLRGYSRRKLWRYGGWWLGHCWELGP